MESSGEFGSLPISGSDGCAFFPSTEEKRQQKRGKIAQKKLNERKNQTEQVGKSENRNKLERQRLRLLLL